MKRSTNPVEAAFDDLQRQGERLRAEAMRVPRVSVQKGRIYIAMGGGIYPHSVEEAQAICSELTAAIDKVRRATE